MGVHSLILRVLELERLQDKLDSAISFKNMNPSRDFWMQVQYIFYTAITIYMKLSHAMC